jgi:hypothetical protein
MSSKPLDLLARLRAQSVTCQREPLDSFHGLTLGHDRVHCLLALPGHERPFAGFWLHEGAGLAFVGLWSGRLFRLMEPDRIVEFAVDFTKEIDKTPREIPPRLLERYPLTRCDLLIAWPRTADERLDDIRRQKLRPYFLLDGFVGAIQPRVDECTADSDGFVTIRKGGAAILTRFPGAGSELVTSFVLLIDGRWPGTAEQNNLLQTIESAVGCAYYDVIWKSRVHWDDPYYGATSDADRPERPRGPAPIG